MEIYQDKYRIPSTRAPYWNYGWNAAYFVTICTQNRTCWFGEVQDDEMVLSDIGQMAHQCWLDIPQHFPFVKLDSFIVMPNHVHGIIIIDKPGGEIETKQPNTPKKRNVLGSVETQYFASENVNRDLLGSVETQNIASLQGNIVPNNPISPHGNIAQKIPTLNKFGPQSQNLASIVRGYKIGVTKFARRINSEFAWQSRYHDHIIRNDVSYQNISDYIVNNPLKWQADKFFIS